MLTIDQLKQIVHIRGLSKTDISLLCIAGSSVPVSTAEIRKRAIAVGLKGARSTNFSALLSAAIGKVFRSPDGWELTAEGKKHIKEVAAHELLTSPAAAEARSLRDLLPKIKNEDARSFITDAIVCAEQALFRASVVLSWVGAVSLLQDYVVRTCLTELNTEASRRDAKWKMAKTADDFGRMKESTFLEILSTISVIEKNVKQELDDCLKLRNACGHPTSLKIGPNMVAAHLEVLTLNVYARFV